MTEERGGRAGWVVRGVLLASGRAALGHQVLWTRRLVDLLGATSETFARVVGDLFLPWKTGESRLFQPRTCRRRPAGTAPRRAVLPMAAAVPTHARAVRRHCPHVPGRVSRSLPRARRFLGGSAHRAGVRRVPAPWRAAPDAGQFFLTLEVAARSGAAVLPNLAAQVGARLPASLALDAAAGWESCPGQVKPVTR